MRHLHQEHLLQFGPANNSSLDVRVPNPFNWHKSVDDSAVKYALHVIGGTQNLVYNNLSDTVFVVPANTSKRMFHIRGLLYRMIVRIILIAIL